MMKSHRRMTIVKEGKGFDQTRKILVGIRLDNESKELLDWALVMIAKPQDHVVAVHISRNSVDVCKEEKLLEDYLRGFKGLSEIKKVKLSGKLLSGKSVRKSLVEEANDCSAAVTILGVSKFGAIGCWLSTAKYCAKHLPSTTEIFTVHNGKVVFKRGSDGPIDDLDLGFGVQSDFGDTDSSEFDSNSSTMMFQSSETSSIDTSGELVEKKYIIAEQRKVPIKSVSFNMERIPEQRPGWPLLRRSSFPAKKALDSRKMSVTQWVLGLPDRTPPDTPHSSSSSSDFCSSKSESPLAKDSNSEGVFSRKIDQSLWSEYLAEHEMPFDSNLSEFTWFSYDVLCHATSQFSTGNLIGKGGYSRVYKGTFLDGRQVAVKVLKSSKQAWKDFSLEANIISSLRHRNITPLLGVCISNTELIFVYDLMSRGTLEENLHAENTEKSVLSWNARYSVAVGMAEALQYLHAGCSRPVIHRDVKSSNILLSDNFEPQLSDFGLAVWRPNSSSSETYTEVVGTFGYLAPEYFMYGKITDKLDVYSFGVILLELLSGKKPINSCKGQESLVMWAKPKLASRKLNELLDPRLDGSFNESQMQRMVLAATLCLTRAATRRPNMGQILKLLKGEETMESWVKAHAYEHIQEIDENPDVDDYDHDGVYQNSSKANAHLSLLALLGVEGEITSCSSVEPIHSPCLEDFLSGRCSVEQL